MRRSGQVLAPLLSAAFLAASIGIAIVPWREPASTAMALKSEPATTQAAAFKRQPADAPVVVRREPSATPRAAAPLAIKCKVGLASCRRWIALRHRNAQPAVRSAER